jgi:chemotaxis protein methyltransferase CheR
MDMGLADSFVRATMSNDLFRRLSEFIYAESGIKMPLSKKTMLEARLQKRLRTVGLNSFGEYCNYLFSPEGIANELVHMIDQVSTNKTDFFREPVHFEYLVENVVPELINRKGSGIRRKFMIWSAGCATGEEPYTLAIVMDEFSRKAKGFHYMVLGTDISSRVLDTARLGIYAEERIEPIPALFKNKYLMRGKDGSNGRVRVVPELRAHVQFRRLNFMAGDFGMREHMDVIFCRNVLIYFEKSTQETVVRRLCKHLIPGGYLFTGHTETLIGLDVPLEQVGNTIYRRTP